jgi:flagellar hook-basal body complex protein FliE
MKQYTLKTYTRIIRVCAVTTAIALLSLVLFSFSFKQQFADEFLKQLGINKTTAESKMNSGFLWGSFDEYGLSKAKNIAIGNRAAIVKDVMSYAMKYTASNAFVKQYNEMRLKEKPAASTLKTPEEMQKEMIAEAKKNVTEAETNLKKADASLKSVFETVLKEARKQQADAENPNNKMIAEAKKNVTEAETNLKKADASLKSVFETVLKEARKQQADAENPNNKMIASYRKNYERGVKDADAGNKRLMDEWETKYPTNHMLYVKIRLQQFLEETKDIDFTAQVVTINGKKYFVSKAYESKGKRWKMGFRAGKEAVETARTLVQQWMNEIK